jgi:hypothetical protein
MSGEENAAYVAIETIHTLQVAELRQSQNKLFLDPSTGLQIRRIP